MRFDGALGVALLVLIAGASCTVAAVPAPADVGLTAGAPFYPSPRAGAAMVYDPVDHYVVLFGGSNGAADTWTFADDRWTELSEPVSPSARMGACSAWDGSAGYWLLYGGELGGPGGALTNDTWSFVHGNWTELHPTISPPPLVWASCAYDATDGTVVMFGGSNSTDTTSGSTWTFAEGQWTLQPVRESPRLIPDRFGAALFYSDSARFVDLYGGQGNTTPLTDSWEWISQQWQEVNSGTPPTGSVLASVAYDNATSIGLLFGGATSFNGSTTDSTWTFGLNNRWTLAPAGPGPSVRFAGAFAFDGTSQSFVLFGGWSSTAAGSPALNDTWTYAGTTWTNLTGTADHPPPPPSNGTSGLSEPLLEYILAGGVVIAAVAAIAAYRSRRRPPKTPAPPVASRPESAKEK
jgi:hypothetical protein